MLHWHVHCRGRCIACGIDALALARRRSRRHRPRQRPAARAAQRSRRSLKRQPSVPGSERRKPLLLLPPLPTRRQTPPPAAASGVQPLTLTPPAAPQLSGTVQGLRKQRMPRRMQQSCCGRCGWPMTAVPHQRRDRRSRSRSGPSEIIPVQRRSDTRRHVPLPAKLLAMFPCILTVAPNKQGALAQQRGLYSGAGSFRLDSGQE